VDDHLGARITIRELLGWHSFQVCGDAKDGKETKKETQKETKPVTTNEVAVIKTTAGEMVVEFWPDVAPKTVENFLQYVNSGFYKGTTFHRVIDGETIIVYQGKRAVAEIRPIAETEKLRPVGLAEGEFVVPDDFDDPLPDDLLDAFEGR